MTPRRLMDPLRGFWIKLAQEYNVRVWFYKMNDIFTRGMQILKWFGGHSVGVWFMLLLYSRTMKFCHWLKCCSKFVVLVLTLVIFPLAVINPGLVRADCNINLVIENCIIFMHLLESDYLTREYWNSIVS